MFESGFFGSRATLAIDSMGLAILLVLPVQVLSLYFIKLKKYAIHKKIQLGIAAVMLVAILVFEVQMRIYGWRHLAEESPYYESYLLPSLLIHLIFAIPAVTMWIVTIFGAIKNFATPPSPSNYSIIHKRRGKLSVFLTFGTCVTAWLFYWLAFVT